MNGLIVHYRQSLPPTKRPLSKNVYVNRWTKDMRSAFGDAPDTQLSGIFDSLKQLVSPYVASAGAKFKQEFQDKLADAQRSLEEKIGTFLTTGQKIYDLRTRSKAQENSSKPEVRSRAVAITAKANALLSNYDALKSQSLGLVQNLVSLKNQITADPLFNMQDPTKMGTRVIELFNKYKSQVGESLAQSSSMAARILAHNKETDRLASDVASLESYAQGKGWGATLENVGGAYMGLSKTALMVAGVGLTAYFLVPRLLARR